jgi:hypothetical protein
LNIAGDHRMSVAALDTGCLKELDLPEIGRRLPRSRFAALLADDRFDQVDPGDERRWFLRRLEPVEALETPEPLRYTPGLSGDITLPPDLQQLAFQLDDEWSEGIEEMAERRAAQTTTILLTFPHVVCGTLPLNRRTRPLLPLGHGERTMITLVDGRWGNHFLAWVNLRPLYRRLARMDGQTQVACRRLHHARAPAGGDRS